MIGRRAASAAAMVSHQRVAPDADELDRAAGMLAAAKRPVILAGRGAVESDARKEIDNLALRVDALLATTLLAHSFFRGHPSDIGIMGGFNKDLWTTKTSPIKFLGNVDWKPVKEGAGRAEGGERRGRKVSSGKKEKRKLMDA